MIASSSSSSSSSMLSTVEWASFGPLGRSLTLDYVVSLDGLPQSYGAPV